MTSLITFLIALSPAFHQTTPADTVSLQYCYKQAYQNYPTAGKIELQKKITALKVNIANTGYFPQINIKGQATYQSEVPEFPSSAGVAPEISQDQYEASLNVNQTIFNSGVTGIRKELEKAKGKQQIYSIQATLYQIRSQVNQVYYGLLLSGQKLRSAGLAIENLEEQLSVIQSKVEHGVMLPSKLHVLKAELIKVQQDSASVQLNIKTGYEILSLLIGEKIPFGTTLALPSVQINYQILKPRRPQLKLFSSSINVLERQQDLAEAGKWPRLSAFGTAAYGRPGLNFLNDEFHGYYIIGLKLQWDFWNFINSDRTEQVLQIRQQQIVQDERAFRLQLNTELERIRREIDVIQENITRGKKIVALREQIVEENASQLKYGVITASDYVTALTKLSRAQLSLFMSQVELSQAKITYMTTLGIPLQK